MNAIDRRDIAMHISVLGWLYIAGNAFLLVLAAFGFFLLPMIGVISRDSDTITVLSVIGTVFGVLMIALGIPGLLARYGLPSTPVDAAARDDSCRAWVGELPIRDGDWRIGTACFIAAGGN